MFVFKCLSGTVVFVNYSTAEDALEYGTRKVLGVIRRHIGELEELTLPELKSICRYDFGIPVRSFEAPTEFFGEARGDDDGDNGAIYLNSRHPISIQKRIIIHELTEVLTRRDMPDVWTRTFPLCQVPADEIKHSVACRVEGLA